MITKKILAAGIASQPAGDGAANAIDFDGVNDYLSRSSDLVGNTDGKTFTFSAWVWPNNTTDFGVYNAVLNEGSVQSGFAVYAGSNYLQIQARNPSGSLVLSVTVGAQWSYQTWNHVLISVDLTDTAKRSIYINDIPQPVTWNTYNNDLIDFTRPEHKIGVKPDSSKYQSRLSNVFLDKNYRDLSIEANRRIFITADRKTTDKSTLQALNPILYLPLDDSTQAGKNLGTGGDFTLNGVVARSGRGPNQFNAVYSDLDGSMDYLSRASALVGVSNGKQLTISFDFICDSITNTPVVHMSNGSVGILLISATGNISCFSLTGSPIFNVQTGLSIVIGRNYHVAMSFDLTNTAKRFVYINGVQVSATYSSYNNIDIPLASSSSITIGRQHLAGNSIDGRLGNVFFDAKYIDLSIPANLAKFVTGTGIDAKPVYLGANGELPFGTPPLIYLPMYGSNAGKNYGSGGDFTVNSGPFTGARGPNEFWGNKADFDGSTGYLARTSALAAVSDGKTFSLVFSFLQDTNQNAQVFEITTSGFVYRFSVDLDMSGRLTVKARNSSGTAVLNIISANGMFNYSTQRTAFVSVDLTDSLKTRMWTADNSSWVSGIDATPTINILTNDNIKFSESNSRFGNNSSALWYNGKLSEFYFTTEYIDFSQEANRLKFRDAFGNPVDLRPQIAAGTLPNPAIYMRFDPSNFGKNSGTGGDFVVNGTITDGGQL